MPRLASLTESYIGISVNLLLLLALAHICIPRARSRTRKFFEMSGYNPSDNTFVQSWDDAYYVFFWIVVFTGVRAATMDFVLKPFAAWGGIQTKKGRTRFAEQGWLFVYYSGFWALGMVSTYRLSYPIPDCDQSIFAFKFRILARMCVLTSTSSTSTTTRNTGLTSKKCGPTSPPAQFHHSWNGTTSFKPHSGCNNSLLSTSKNAAKTIGKCLPITSSQVLSSSPVTASTKQKAGMWSYASWTLLTSYYL